MTAGPTFFDVHSAQLLLVFWQICQNYKMSDFPGYEITKANKINNCLKII